jgi:hypothetical protein
MESMTAVGGLLGGVVWIMSCRVIGDDQVLSSSLTLKEMVWVPTARDVVLKEAWVLKAPAMDEVHS